ncbi:unnamed protein product [Auanema sp. JU1783]|nr:unnamed protein product [Auanema sp. JU1783]
MTLFYALFIFIFDTESEPTIGWVGSRPGVTCHYRTGQVLKIPTGALTLPGWYLICYVMPDGCQTCILDILCENEFMEACSDKYILSSSPISSNSSIDYWVQIGKKFPFAQSSSVELNVRNQRTKKFVTTEHMKAQVDTITNLTIHGLEPHEFYNVERCLRVKLPLALTSDARFTFSDDLKTNGSTFCSEEMFRTLRNSSQNPSTFLPLAIIFFFFSFGDNIAGKCGL